MWLPVGAWLPVLERAPRGTIALTFDDGPSPVATPMILDLLARRSIQATFFLLGERIARWPELARAIVQDGHEVYAHGYHHTRLDEVAAADLYAELDSAEALLNDMRPTPSPYLVRLPYGAGHHCEAVHERLRKWRPDCQIAHWGYDTRDFLLAKDGGSQEELAASCAATAAAALASPGFAGSIVLMHEDPFGARGDLAALAGPMLLERLLDGAARAGIGFALPTRARSPLLQRRQDHRQTERLL